MVKRTNLIYENFIKIEYDRFEMALLLANDTHLDKKEGNDTTKLQIYYKRNNYILNFYFTIFGPLSSCGEFLICELRWKKISSVKILIQ